MGRSTERRQERRTKRKGLSLRKSLISAQLLKRYQFVLVHIVNYLADCNLRVQCLEDLDEAISSWVEYIFFEGEAKGLASDGLASLQYHLPQSAGHLRMSWKLVRTWQKIEPPTRVIPISPMLARAFAGACVLVGKIAEAAAILMAFDGLLRPGEMYMILAKDITFYRSKAVLTLRDTKTGKRKGAGEMVVINSSLANHWLRMACKNKSRNDPLLLDGAPAFRLLFKNLVSHFGLQGLYAVGSLRRGGATWDFLLHQSMERTLLRGRWTSTSSARIYLQDSVATVANLTLTPLPRMHARMAGAALGSP